MWRSLVIVLGAGALGGLGLYAYDFYVVEHYHVMLMPGGPWAAIAIGAVLACLWLWATGYTFRSKGPDERE